MDLESPLRREASWLALIQPPMQSLIFMPLQSRFLPSSTATLILILFSLVSLIPHFAYATDADSIAHDDHNHPRIRDLQDQSGVAGTLELMQGEESQSYEPTFAGLDRSILGRAPDRRTLTINTSTMVDINRGDTHYWKVQSAPESRNLAQASLSHGEINNGDFYELLKRQDWWWMNISLSICDISKPGQEKPPAMRLDISRSDSEPLSDSQGSNITTVQGFGSTYLKVTSDVDLSVYVDESSDFEGTYTYELTASTGVRSYPGLTFLDSDYNSILLASEVDANLSSLRQGIPYGIYVHPSDSLISWIPDSTCALKKLAHIKGNPSNDQSTANVTTMMTNLRGLKQQLFHVTGLNPGTSYWATIAIDGNNSQEVAGRGSEKFTTKSDSNCAVIYNLSFCTNASYAVPYNPNTIDLSSLAAFYDNQTEALYKNFNFSLQQIPCNTTSSAQYSLARNCTDCARAYKSWLCAVTIPRCQDFSAGDDWLQPRSVSQRFWNNSTPSGVATGDPALSLSNKTRKVMNSSRNPMIDQRIKPEPWKEVLPCEDLCYELVQSCPAALAFKCPAGKWLGYSYGKRKLGLDITCNNPNQKWKPNAAGRGVGTNIWGVWVAFGFILMLQLVGAE